MQYLLLAGPKPIHDELKLAKHLDMGVYDTSNSPPSNQGEKIDVDVVLSDIPPEYASGRTKQTQANGLNYIKHKRLLSIFLSDCTKFSTLPLLCRLVHVYPGDVCLLVSLCCQPDLCLRGSLWTSGQMLKGNVLLDFIDIAFKAFCIRTMYPVTI